ncbi:MAG: RluA family pseudouridine synthase [Nitrospiraceae bacterium]|nr:RluA family pseudouridine synthase [Nitrospiraceae bacterium]
MVNLKVEKEYDGIRLDVFLSSKVEGLSRSQAKSIVKNGVMVNDKLVKKPSYPVSENDEVVFEIPEPKPLGLEAEDIAIDIVYEDSDIIVVNKPAGLVVHPAPGHYSGTLVNALLHHCKDLSGINGTLRPGIVHRLDKDTSGLMVVAKNGLSQENLSRQFRERKVEKFYRTFVYGLIKEDRGTIEVPIGRDKFNRKRFSTNTSAPRHAKTDLWVIKRYEDYNVTDVKCKIETGRTHQIRVHMSHMGFPILNDKLYGFKASRVKSVKLKSAIEDMHMNALCSYHLKFKHPRSGKPMEFEIDLPPAMKKILDILSVSTYTKAFP